MYVFCKEILTGTGFSQYQAGGVSLSDFFRNFYSAFHYITVIEDITVVFNIRYGSIMGFL